MKSGETLHPVEDVVADCSLELEASTVRSGEALHLAEEAAAAHCLYGHKVHMSAGGARHLQPGVVGHSLPAVMFA